MTDPNGKTHFKETSRRKNYRGKFTRTPKFNSIQSQHRKMTETYQARRKTRKEHLKRGHLADLVREILEECRWKKPNFL